MLDELSIKRDKRNANLPSCKHLNEMCLGGSGFIALLQTGEDAILALKGPASRTLHLKHLLGTDVGPGWDDVKVEVLAEHNDSGSLRVVILGEMLAVLGCTGRDLGRDGRGDGAEELEHVLQGMRIILAQLAN